MLATLSNAYDQLTGSQYSQLEISELYSQERFSDDQMSLPDQG